MNNYTSLKASIAAWLAQDNLTAYVDDFLDIAEARVSRLLRIRPMESVTTIQTVVGDDYVDLPADYLEIRAVHTDAARKSSLEYVTPELLNSMTTGSARPRFFSVRGDQLVFPGVCDAEYDLILSYYAKFPALSDSTTTNWLTANYPQVLLYGALQAAAEFIHDDEQLAKWNRLFTTALTELQESDKRENYGPAPVMRHEGPSW
jgi:hypothetical protein